MHASCRFHNGADEAGEGFLRTLIRQEWVCNHCATPFSDSLRKGPPPPPGPNSIKQWHMKFEEEGCLCKGKSPGRPSVSHESVERVCHHKVLEIIITS
jgi:hypothetical protein